MRGTRTRPFCLILATLALTLAGCKEKPCDVKEAIEKSIRMARSRRVQPLLEIRFAVGIDPKTRLPYPKAIALEEVEGTLAGRASLATGVKIQLLDSSGGVVFEDGAPNVLLALGALVAPVLRSGNAEHLGELSTWISKIELAIRVPRDPRGVTARFSIQGLSDALKGRLGNIALPSKVFDFPLAALPRRKATPGGRGTADPRDRAEKLHYTGNPHNRVNFVILADGYREEELPLFREQAQALKDALLATVPFRDRQGLLNVWRLDTPSEESGVRCDDGTYSVGKKNRFGSVFPLACVNAKHGADYSDRFIVQTGFREVADALNLLWDGQPQFPVEIFVLANSPKHGGTAIVWASQSNASPPHTFMHELGHSFGGLADEYVKEKDSCLLYPYFMPNISTRKSKAESVKWSHWIDEGTPVPTPDEDAFDGKTGLFKGAGNCKDLFYRPERTCKMNESEQEAFCKVCRERVMLRLYDAVRPIEGDIAAARLADSGVEATYRFSVVLPHRWLKTTWLVDGKEVQATEEYQDLVMTLEPGDREIKVVVFDPTEYVRKNQCHLIEARRMNLRLPPRSAASARPTTSR